MYPCQTLGFAGAGILQEQPGRGLERTFQPSCLRDKPPLQNRPGAKRKGLPFCNTPPNPYSCRGGRHQEMVLSSHSGIEAT